MTTTADGPAPTRARVLLSPDGRLTAVWREPKFPGNAPWHLSDGGRFHDEQVTGWIPMLPVTELREQLAHWKATGPGRRTECKSAPGCQRPGHCCFPEGLEAAELDITDLISTTEETTWKTPTE